MSDTERATESIPVPDLPASATDSLNIPLPFEPAFEDAPDKPKRGRPPGSRNRSHKRKPPAEPIPDPALSPEDIDALAAALGFSLSLGFEYVATERGSHWRLSADESGQLGRLWSVALAPYLTGAGKHTPLIAATVGTFGILAPRLIQDRRVPALMSRSLAESVPEPGPAPDGAPDPIPADVLARAAAGESPIPIDPPKPRRVK